MCGEIDNDKLNDIAITCAELTACCNALTLEWLNVLSALCNSSCSSDPSYIDVQNQVDIRDLSIHNSLAVFTSILIGKSECIHFLKIKKKFFFSQYFTKKYFTLQLVIVFLWRTLYVTLPARPS